MGGFDRESRRLLRTLSVVAATLLARSPPRRSPPEAFLASDTSLPPTTPQNPAGVAAGTAFLQGLHELGYVEGRTLVIERRHADGSVPITSSDDAAPMPARRAGGRRVAHAATLARS